MGEAFISQKKEQFQHRRDKSVQNDFKEPNLRSLFPDISITLYRCVAHDATKMPDVGDPIALAEFTPHTLSVLKQNIIIGSVVPEDANKLLKGLAHRSVRMLTGLVHSVGNLDLTFKIQLNTKDPEQN